MEFGFILTIVLLGAVLGLFARQALATAEERVAPTENEQTDAPSQETHPHAM